MIVTSLVYEYENLDTTSSNYEKSNPIKGKWISCNL